MLKFSRFSNLENTSLPTIPDGFLSWEARYLAIIIDAAGKFVLLDRVGYKSQSRKGKLTCQSIHDGGKFRQ